MTKADRVPTDEDVRAASMIAYPRIMEALLEEREMVRRLLERIFANPRPDDAELRAAAFALKARSRLWQ